MEQLGFQNKSLVSIILRILLLLINNTALPFFVFKSFQGMYFSRSAVLLLSFDEYFIT